jgi:hypothetical protein
VQKNELAWRVAVITQFANKKAIGKQAGFIARGNFAKNLGAKKRFFQPSPSKTQILLAVGRNSLKNAKKTGFLQKIGSFLQN